MKDFEASNFRANPTAHPRIRRVHAYKRCHALVYIAACQVLMLSGKVATMIPAKKRHETCNTGVREENSLSREPLPCKRATTTPLQTLIWCF